MKGYIVLCRWEKYDKTYIKATSKLNDFLQDYTHLNIIDVFKCNNYFKIQQEALERCDQVSEGTRVYETDIHFIKKQIKNCIKNNNNNNKRKLENDNIEYSNAKRQSTLDSPVMGFSSIDDKYKTFAVPSTQSYPHFSFETTTPAFPEFGFNNINSANNKQFSFPFGLDQDNNTSNNIKTSKLKD